MSNNHKEAITTEEGLKQKIELLGHEAGEFVDGEF